MFPKHPVSWSNNMNIIKGTKNKLLQYRRSNLNGYNLGKTIFLFYYISGKRRGETMLPSVTRYRTKPRRLVPDIFVGNSKRSLVSRLCIGERWLRMTDSVSRKESFGETGETISKRRPNFLTFNIRLETIDS